jgi:hypothetical protein
LLWIGIQFSRVALVELGASLHDRQRMLEEAYPVRAFCGCRYLDGFANGSLPGGEHPRARHRTVAYPMERATRKGGGNPTRHAQPPAERRRHGAALSPDAAGAQAGTAADSSVPSCELM